MVFPKFVSFWVLEFCSVGELSCQGCELEIKCQIAYPSVTGKVRNLRKGELILVNFGVCHPQCLNRKNVLRAGGRAESAL